MRTKILKGFFDLARKSGHGFELVRTVPDLAVTEGGCQPEPGMIHVAECPQFAGVYGMVYSEGYVEPQRLAPLRNTKPNRDRVRQWAKAKRDGIQRSENWYQIYKGCQA